MLRDRLSERTRRLVAAAGARADRSRRGVAALLSCAHRTTDDPPRAARARRARRGGASPRAETAGRTKVARCDPELTAALERLVEPVTHGDPKSPLRWTVKSVRRRADELRAQGHPTSRKPSQTSCARWATACRGTPGRANAAAIRTATHSSSMSIPGAGATRRPRSGDVGGHEAEGDRRGLQKTPGVSGVRKASRKGCACTPSSITRSARRSPTACTTSGATSGRAASA